ncbi:MAG TPA: ATP-binding protein [Thermoplasmata archaeon]|nr:ATP-binding protein [Thermoplasmata archaeon]
MSAGDAGAPPPSRPAAGTVELASFLAAYLRGSGPKFVVVTGAVGAGKSTLLRTLLPALAGPKLYLAYQTPTPSAAPPPGTGGEAPMVSMLLADPQFSSVGPDPSSRSVPGAPLAFSPQDAKEAARVSAPIEEAAGRLSAAGAGTIVVDSWDRGSEAFFRAQAPLPGAVRTFSAPASDIAGMQAGIVSSQVHLILAVTPELGAPLLTLADAVVELRAEERARGRLRVHEVTKTRGASAPPARSLYTLEGERFRSLPPLPSGFRPTVSLPDPDPAGSAESIWPGLASIESVLGRLRYGAMTGISVGGDASDAIPIALTAPAAVHVLRIGGRVAWIPAPSVRPSKLIAQIGGALPVDWLRERLRILSASGDDPGLGELRRIVVPLSRESADAREARPATPPGVTSLFPEVYRFLRDHPAPGPALYVASLEGLRAAAQAAGVTITDSTLPAVAGFYMRLPRFHLLAYGSAEDPAARLLMPVAETLVHLEMAYGRPVIFGDRPNRPASILDWSGTDGRLNAVPVG